MLRGSTPVADFVCATAVMRSQDSEDMKFTLNSATDTLPHNSNLVRWYRGTLSNACKLCGQKQTLVYIHILNNCDVALKLRRYIQQTTRSSGGYPGYGPGIPPKPIQDNSGSGGQLHLPVPHHPLQPSARYCALVR